MYRVFLAVAILAVVAWFTPVRAQDIPPAHSTSGVNLPQATPTLGIFTPTPTGTATATATPTKPSITLQPLPTPTGTRIPEKDCRVAVNGCRQFLPVVWNVNQRSGE